MPTLRDIKRVLLSDGEVMDLETVQFIVGCLRETGGIRRVGRDLDAIGFGEICEQFYLLLGDAKQTGTLHLEALNRDQLKKVCMSVVSTLDACHDLHTLMLITVDQGVALTARI